MVKKNQSESRILRILKETETINLCPVPEKRFTPVLNLFLMVKFL
jgi:hypothetical protein